MIRQLPLDKVLVVDLELSDITQILFSPKEALILLIRLNQWSIKLVMQLLEVPHQLLNPSLHQVKPMGQQLEI